VGDPSSPARWYVCALLPAAPEKEAAA
jgi:hypothetical protein